MVAVVFELGDAGVGGGEGVGEAVALCSAGSEILGKLCYLCGKMSNLIREISIKMFQLRNSSLQMSNSRPCISQLMSTRIQLSSQIHDSRIQSSNLLLKMMNRIR